MSMSTPREPTDLVEEVVAVDGRDLRLLRPRDSEALLDEEAFEREEFLPYWAELWPSSLALARAIAGRALRGARTLELGCGLGLPSIAAALAGGRVLATDWSADAVELTAANAERNGAGLDTLVCSWTEPDAAPRRGAVGPRARLRRPLRAPQRRPAARAAAAPDRRGLARRPRPPARRAVPRGGAPGPGRSRRRRSPELAKGAVHRLRSRRLDPNPGGTRPWRAGRVPPRPAVRTTWSQR